MIVLFAIVFIGLLGFGIILPILPFMAVKVGASPELVTITFALYSLGQMFGAPFWGRMSDRVGRKPVLAISMAGATISYLMLAFADSIMAIMAARLFGGLMAGNVSVAYAYISDTTSEENRAQSMGLMGAAFGLGFIFGPAFGGLLAGPEIETANFFLPSVCAASLSMTAFVGVFLFLKESLPPHKRRTSISVKLNPSETFERMRSAPVIPAFVVLNFIVLSFWALLEAVFAIWTEHVLDFGPRDVSLFFAFIGLLSATTQGLLVGPLARRFGEANLVQMAFVSMFTGFVLMMVTTELLLLFVATVFLAFGNSIFNPSLASLVSKVAHEKDRGSVMGIMQGAGSFGRVVGPMSAGFIFVEFGPSSPYAFAAFGMVIGLCIFVLLMRTFSTQLSRH